MGQVHSPKKSKHSIVDQYFGKHNKFRNDRWVFGDSRSGAYLTKFAWTEIVRHTMVVKGASPVLRLGYGDQDGKSPVS